MTCQKIPFTSQKEAIKHINVMMASKRTEGKFSAYFCPHCWYFHLTTMKKKDKKAARKKQRGKKK